jgi:hypothetical protein
MKKLSNITKQWTAKIAEIVFISQFYQIKLLTVIRSNEIYHHYEICKVFLVIRHNFKYHFIFWKRLSYKSWKYLLNLLTFDIQNKNCKAKVDRINQISEYFCLSSFSLRCNVLNSILSEAEPQIGTEKNDCHLAITIVVVVVAKSLCTFYLPRQACQGDKNVVLQVETKILMI